LISGTADFGSQLSGEIAARSRGLKRRQLSFLLAFPVPNGRGGEGRLGAVESENMPNRELELQGEIDRAKLHRKGACLAPDA